MDASSIFRLSALFLLLVVGLPVFHAQVYPTTPNYSSTQQNFSTTGKPNSYNCGRSIFNDTIGNITSPNYPFPYEDNQFCTYMIVAPSLSTINFTILRLDLEPHIYCFFDWIEFTCQSNSISQTVRYCGANNRWNVTFKPCSRVIMRFVSDTSAVGQGFFVSYNITPISCQGNCAPVAIGSGYNCTCDVNQPPFVPPPYDQCPVGCYLSSSLTSNSTKYCACLASLNTTTTTPNYQTPTAPSCPDGCYPSYDRFGYPVCYCNTTVSPTTSPIECPYGCYIGQDSYGYPICRCEGTTRSAPCPFGCYNVTYYTGYSYCECSSPQSATPLTVTCPSGCTPDTDYWGTPYCRCNSSYPTTTSNPLSTNPPPCHYPCYYRYFDYGDPYCECSPDNRTSNATDAPCYYPCYYNYDNYNRRYCSCGLSTAVAPCYYPCRYDYDYYGHQYCNCNSTTNSSCNYPCYYGYDSNWNYVCLCNTTTTVAPCYYPCRYEYDYYGRQYCNCNSTTNSSCNYPCYYGYDSNWNYVCLCNATTTVAPCYYPCRYEYDYYGHQYCNCNSTTNSSCNYPCYYGYDSNWNYVCLCNATTTVAPCYYPCRYEYDYYGRQYCNCNSTTSTNCNYPCYYGYDSYYNYVCLCNYTSTTVQPPTLPPGCNMTKYSTIGTLMSPNYPSPYPKNLDCVQTITVPMANSFQLTFLDLALFFTSNDSCTYEWVEITGCDGSVKQYCSYTSVNVPIEFFCTRSYNLMVLFHSYSYNFYNRGFKLNYRSTFGSSCNSTGGLVPLGGHGSIVSPNYPDSYPLSNDCYYVLQTEERQTIRIRVAFELLMMQETLACNMEFIKMNCLDGSGNTKYVCGTRVPSPVTFNCSSVEIQFHTETPPSAFRYPRLFKIVYYGIEGAASPSNTSVSSAASLHSRLGSSGAGAAGSVLLVLFVTLAMKNTA